jgi:hypothetical protein
MKLKSGDGETDLPDTTKVKMETVKGSSFSLGRNKQRNTEIKK